MKVIDYAKSGNVIRLYFGYDKIEDYHGDDWDDVSYEHNASLVYTEFIRGYYDIAFPLEYVVNEASTGYCNSPYSKNDLKKRVVPCLHIINETTPSCATNDGWFMYVTYDIYFNNNIDSLKKSIKRFGGRIIKCKLFKRIKEENNANRHGSMDQGE